MFIRYPDFMQLDIELYRSENEDRLNITKCSGCKNVNYIKTPSYKKEEISEKKEIDKKKDMDKKKYTDENKETNKKESDKYNLDEILHIIDEEFIEELIKK
ncbi:MAG: hypothetical protein RSB70_02245 [Clostridium sp.]